MEHLKEAFIGAKKKAIYICSWYALSCATLDENEQMMSALVLVEKDVG